MTGWTPNTNVSTVWGTPVVVDINSAILLETGDHLLLETGFQLLLESGLPLNPWANPTPSSNIWS